LFEGVCCDTGLLGVDFFVGGELLSSCTGDAAFGVSRFSRNKI
jgi:hypothetical protein